MDFSPLIISLKVAAISTVCTLVFGIVIAYYVTNLKRYKSFFDGVFTLAMIMPPTVIGFFLLVIMGRNGVIGKFLEKFDVEFVFTLKGAVLASIIVSFPLMYTSVRSAFESIDENIVLVAKTLGLSNIKVFFKIVLPLSLNGIIAGVVMSFARALGEFGATIMFAGNIKGQTQTISIKIYSAMQAGDLQTVYFWVSIMIIICFFSVVIINTVTKKKN